MPPDFLFHFDKVRQSLSSVEPALRRLASPLPGAATLGNIIAILKGDRVWLVGCKEIEEIY